MVLSTSFHWRGPSILKFECIIGIAHRQTGIFLESYEKGVHHDVTVKDGIQIWRNPCFHKCIIFCGLVTHIAYLPLFGDVKTIKMIVLQSVIPAALVCAQFAVAKRGTRAGDKQLVVATMVAAAVVVYVLTLGSRAKLLVVLLLDQVIADPSKKNTLKVLGESL
jgi:hypothetical protein